MLGSEELLLCFSHFQEFNQKMFLFNFFVVACHERMIQKEVMSLGLYYIHMMLKGFLVKSTREDRPRYFHEERKRINFPFGWFFAHEVVGFLVCCSFFYS